MKTEDEARKLWCPLAMKPGDWQTGEPGEYAAASGNRIGGGRPNDGCRCIASGCMAWRWDESSKQAPYSAGGNPRKPESEWEGYCGAFGKDD